MSKNIAVIGTGYVGLVTAVGLADFGNPVIGVDIKPEVVESLNRGVPTIYEHGIDDYLNRNLEAERLFFTTDIRHAVRQAEIIFIAVGTPSKDNGEADLSQIETVLDSIAAELDGFKVIVTKSTVPVGTNRWIAREISARLDPAATSTAPSQESADLPSPVQHSTSPDRRASFAVASNPEFLREGKAVQDFFHPDRIVIGYEDERAKEALEDVYRSLYIIHVPFVWCNLETAELIKYASNAFLATKIMFINQMANLAEAAEADIHVIARTMGMDGRISPKFLHPGPGYGGSCFPKDTRALASTGDHYNVDMSLIKEVIDSNETQKKRVVTTLKSIEGDLGGKTVALLGLAFKAETDDIRESPSVTIAESLLAEDAKVRVHDPKAVQNFYKLFGDNDKITYCSKVFEALENADVCLILTEWNEYRNLDLEKTRKLMQGDLIYDTRNLLEPGYVKAAGLRYRGLGRK